MKVPLRDLALLVGGQLCGDGNIEISGAATLHQAGPGDITLADTPKLANKLAQSTASAVVVSHSYCPEAISYVAVSNVHAAFATIVAHFRPLCIQRQSGISPHAFISPSAQIAPNVNIFPGAFVGENVTIQSGTTIHSGVRILAGCQIGHDVTLFPNVVLYENTLIGDRCIIHGGAVIGAYGFGYATVDGQHRLSAQLGHVEIGCDVEIGACSTIDRGTYDATTIGQGTKVDNQVMIAHNCRIGQHNLLCSHVGIAGSCTTGDYVVMAGQVGIGDHIHIGHQVVLGAKAGVMNDIADGQSHVGIPATPLREQMVKQAALAKLPEMRKQLKDLQRKIDQLTRLGPPASQSEAA